MKPEKENIIVELRDEPKHLVIQYSNFAHFKLCNCLQVTSMSALQRTISSSANYGVLPTEELKPGFSVERFVCGRSFQKQTLIKLKNSGKSFFCLLPSFCSCESVWVEKLHENNLPWNRRDIVFSQESVKRGRRRNFSLLSLISDN